MKWKISALLVLAALPGVVATSWLALPLLVDPSKISVPIETLQFATALQSMFLVSAAALIGASVAPKVGLFSPVISAIAGSGNVLDALRPQLLPGFVGGCIGASVIVGFYAFASGPVLALQLDSPLPLVVRVLYGGITEEILIRWGLMTAIVWVGWKYLQRDLRQPSSWLMWAAIIVSALVFGLSHLPAAEKSLYALSAPLVAYITIGNALFGIVAGYLFWRYGLEAAIAAHVSAHLLAFILRG